MLKEYFCYIELVMPSYNPKHKKARDSVPLKMGIKKNTELCIVGSCGKNATHHVALTNVSAYAQKLKWDIEKQKRARRASLCKNHYREYKKLQKKEEKYQRMRDYGPPK